MILPLLGVQAPTQQDIINLINDKPPAIVKVVEPTLQDKIKKNYYKCKTDIEYIRADNARCLAKPVQTVSKTTQTKKTVKSAVRASNRNDMTPGYCTFWVKQNRPDLPSGLGNANSWYSRASSIGLAVGSVPKIGAVATTTRGAEGHVALVIGMSGSQIQVSEMNVQGWNVVSTAWYPSNTFQYIY
jgi:surface antigen